MDLGWKKWNRRRRQDFKRNEVGKERTRGGRTDRGACRRGGGISGEGAGLVDKEKRNLKRKQEFAVCKKYTQSILNFHGLPSPHFDSK
jgi:hypothetical protein